MNYVCHILDFSFFDSLIEIKLHEKKVNISFSNLNLFVEI